MEEDFFDVAIEGTTLSDCHELAENQRVIVFDGKNNYGSTYTSVEKLAASPYITGLDIRRNGATDLTIEALPFLLRPDHPAVQKYSRKPFGGRIEYAEIAGIYFIGDDSSVWKWPQNKTDIAMAEQLDNKGRYYLHEAIKKGDAAIIKGYLEKEAARDSIVCKVFANRNIFNDEMFAVLARGFGGASFLYPVHGLGELAENISMAKAIGGYAYLLGKDIRVAEVSNKGEYVHRLDCEYGTLYIKQLIKQNLSKKRCYVRVIETACPVYGGIFLAYAMGAELVKIIGVDGSTKVCADGHQLLYFIKEHAPVGAQDILKLLIADTGIISDICFETVYDPDQF